MAITRREFVTRLGALAAAMGVSQVDLAKMTEALAHGGAAGTWSGGDWTNKPKVIWVHGAECTGCSTSLLSLFEDVRGTAIEGTTVSTLAALNLSVGGSASQDRVISNVWDPTGHPYAHRTLYNTAALTGCDFDNAANSTPYIANIADVLIDFIDLQYHETVGNAAGDLAAKFLADQMDNGSAEAYVLVVEGAVQDKALGGAWNETGAAPWCAIGQFELDNGAGETDARAQLRRRRVRSRHRRELRGHRCDRPVRDVRRIPGLRFPAPRVRRQEPDRRRRRVRLLRGQGQRGQRTRSSTSPVARRTPGGSSYPSWRGLSMRQPCSPVAPDRCRSSTATCLSRRLPSIALVVSRRSTAHRCTARSARGIRTT